MSEDVTKKISSALAAINHLKDKAFIDCVNELIEKDCLVFYDQDVYAEHSENQHMVNFKSACKLTISPRITELENNFNLGKQGS